MYHSPSHVSIITGNILITIFARYHILFASSSTFTTDTQYLVQFRSGET